MELAPHPEGGYFKEVYRSTETYPRIGLPQRYQGHRHYSTSIYFLLKSNEVSKLHRLQSDEIWHLYEGSSVSLHLIFPDGKYQIRHLYRETHPPEYQAIIPAGTWFGATIDEPHAYSLMGCTVAPGFEFADFEIGNRQDLITRFPKYKDIILKLT